MEAVSLHVFVNCKKPKYKHIIRQSNPQWQSRCCCCWCNGSIHYDKYLSGQWPPNMMLFLYFMLPVAHAELFFLFALTFCCALAEHGYWRGPTTPRVAAAERSQATPIPGRSASTCHGNWSAEKATAAWQVIESCELSTDTYTITLTDYLTLHCTVVTESGFTKL